MTERGDSVTGGVPAQPAAAAYRYSAVIYCEMPETRWFHRHILRRQWRREILHFGLLDSFTVERNLNQLSNAVFVMADPMEALLNV